MINPQFHCFASINTISSNAVSRFTTTLTLLLLLATFTAGQQQNTCRPGRFRSPTATNPFRCVPCRPGSYQPSPNATSCIQCPIHSYTPYYGGDSILRCLPCQFPHEISPIGAKKCTRCATGKTGTCGKCLRCPPGTFVSCGKCERCSNREFSTSFNADACEQCPDLTVSSRNRTTCVPAVCPAGYSAEEENEYFGSQLPKNQGLRECWSCTFNQFKNSSSAEGCEECPARSVVVRTKIKQGSRSIELHVGCKQCPPGTFLDTDYDGYRSCETCRNGTTTHGFSKPTCTNTTSTIFKNVSEICPDTDSFFIDADGDCEKCLTNERRDVMINRCVPCPLNTTSNGGRVTRCTRVPQEFVKCRSTQVVAESCTCPAGTRWYNGRCKPCPAGQVRYLSPAMRSCEQCTEDSFSSGSGGEMCMRCPFNTYSKPTRGRWCLPLRKQCPRGYHLPGLNMNNVGYFGANRCVSGRSLCPRGMKRRSLSTELFHQRVLCENRKTGVLKCPRGMMFDKVDACIKCDKGFRIRKRKSDGRLQCVRCSSESVSNGGLVRKCTPCPKGFKDWNRLECYCPIGNYVNAKTGECVDCKPASELTRKSAPFGCIYQQI